MAFMVCILVGRGIMSERTKNMRCAVCGETPPNEVVAYEKQLKWVIEHRKKRHANLKGYALALWTDEVTKELTVIM